MPKRKAVVLIAFIILLLWLWQTEWIQHVLQDDLSYFIQIQQEMGHALLWITLPLSILQGVFTLFPFITIIIIHVLSFGLAQGLLYSWIGSFLGAVSCFVLGRYFFSAYAQKIWSKREHKYHKWSHFFHLYGIWAIIVLRSIPIMPSNMIALMAALSPMGLKPYVWSCVWGNISMVAQLTLIGVGITLPAPHLQFLLYSYILYIGTLLIVFIYQYYKNKRFLLDRQ